MRRIYYVYAIRLATHRNTAHAVLMAGVIVVVLQFVSINAIFWNFLNVQVGQIDTFLYNAVVNTEIWTLLSLAAFLVLSFSLLRNMTHGRTSRLRLA